jgi:hypothetical protein
VSQPSPAQEFAAALHGLYEAAGLPSHRELITQAGRQQPPLRLAARSLSDWFGGRHLPGELEAVRFLVELLQPRAVRRSGYQAQPLDWWLALYQRAQEYKPASRGGRPRTPAPRRPSEAPPRPRWRIGQVPPQADCIQDRQVGADLDAVVFAAGQAAVLTQVLSGLGGVGKTQLAAGLARRLWRDGAVDLLVWVTAASREAILAGYSKAARAVTGVPADDPQQGAERLLNWLDDTDRGWLVVLDDLADPADVKGLWPPANPAGRTVVTTRRRDAVLSAPGRQMVNVGVFNAEEAVGYLRHRLDGDERLLAEAADLAEDVGLLPLALAQTAAYLLDRGLTCAQYRERWADQRRRLPELVPEDGALPEDHKATVATTWALSIARADELHPAGLARPLLELASVLDPNGIPAAVLTSPPALAYLMAHRSAGMSEVDAENAADGLRCLHRLNLADLDPDSPADLDPDSPGSTVRVHALVQRVTREQLHPARFATCSRAAAAALVQAWPEIDRGSALSQALRASTRALHATAGDILWATPVLMSRWTRLRVWLTRRSLHRAHPVLFRAGESLGNAGLFAEASDYYRSLCGISVDRLGPDHPDTLLARHDLAHWRGEAGDPAGAAEAFEQLLVDRLRVLGPDHPATLTTRHSLAVSRARAGDPATALPALEQLLADSLRLLGPDHPYTLINRHEIANGRGQAGDWAGAVRAFEQLLAARLQVLGPNHRDTLLTRHDLAHWQGEAGDPAGAATAFDRLLADQLRVLGPNHRDTLNTRHSVAFWRGQAGDPAGAAEAFEQLLADSLRLFGPDHPGTMGTRHDLASCRGAAGDRAAAVQVLEQLLSDRVRVLGPDHPATLATRHNLAHWRGQTGDRAAAVQALEQLLSDRVRVLDPDHPATLATRHELAHWRGEAGDRAAAVQALERLLADCLRVLCPDHPLTLNTRQALAYWGGAAGGPARAAEAFEQLLADRVRVLAPDHPRILSTRHDLAHWRGEAGDPAGAAEAFEQLLADRVRVLGPDHPHIVTTRDALAYWRRRAQSRPG